MPFDALKDLPHEYNWDKIFQEQYHFKHVMEEQIRNLQERIEQLEELLLEKLDEGVDGPAEAKHKHNDESSQNAE